MTAELAFVTCNEGSEAIALTELRQIMPTIPPPEWLENGNAVEGGILLVKPEMQFDEFARTLIEADPIFTRHISPSQVQVALNSTVEDIAQLVSCSERLASRLTPQISFSVQTRILGEGKLPYRKVTVNESISQSLEALTGNKMDCRNPGQVISVLCTPTTGYIGVSNVRLNRSNWTGGKHRYKVEDGQVSRAEFKLTEALSTFGIELPQDGTALDVGASPGGWSRLLSEAGLIVHAVDPADLDSRLRNVPQIKHNRCRIQEFVNNAGTYDVIVNDMKMDARMSVSIMLSLSHHLAPGGVSIMTLKLPQMSGSTKMSKVLLRMVKENLDRLSSRYSVCGARQLYHNRSEITVALRSGKDFLPAVSRG